MPQQLITVLADPARPILAAQVETLQRQIADIQIGFADTTLAFKAGLLAWEAVRLFHYAVKHEHDGYHIAHVEAAFRWVEHHLQQLESLPSPLPEGIEGGEGVR